MSAIAALSRLLSRLSLAFAAAGLIAMTAIIAWQVFGRFVLGESPAWSEQAALVLMVWYVTIAAAVGVREGFHIRLTALVEALPPGGAKVCRIVAHLIVALFGAGLAYWGGDLVGRTWSHTIPTLGLPRGFAYLPLPIAGALIAFFAAEQLAAAVQGKEVEPLWR